MLYGLFAASDRPNRPFIATVESYFATSRTGQNNTSTPTFTISVNFLRRNVSGQLALVQCVTLSELKTDNFSSFASGPNESVFCAISGSTNIHWMYRAPSATNAPFANASKTYRFHTSVLYICGLQSVGEQRLVASFADKSVRVFRAVDGALSEMQRIRSPATIWTPATLVGLSNYGVCIKSNFKDTTNSTIKRGLELCTVDANGMLSSPRRLAIFSNPLHIWCHVIAKDSSDSGIIVAEYDKHGSNGSTIALRVFLFKEN